MSKIGRVFTDATKFKIVIEAIKGQRQISEIASDFEVHPNQITNWEKQFSEKGSTLFLTKKDSQLVELKNKEEDLFKKIWKQLIELNFLKKSLKKMGTLERKKMIDVKPNKLPVKQECSLLDISRSSNYYKPVPISENNLELLEKIDKIYTESHEYGSCENKRCY